MGRKVLVLEQFMKITQKEKKDFVVQSTKVELWHYHGENLELSMVHRQFICVCWMLGFTEFVVNEAGIMNLDVLQP